MSARFPDSAPNLLTPKAQLREIGKIIDRMAAAFLRFQVAVGPEALSLRTALGDLQAYYLDYFQEGTLGTVLLDCFTTATTVGFDLNEMDHVLNTLLDETPTAGLPTLFTQMAINFSVSQDAHILAAMTFHSRDDIDAMMVRMQAIFSVTIDHAADVMDSGVYAKLMELAAAVTRYLAETARPLPRMVQYEINPRPSLAVANRIYADAARAEEIATENKVVNPVFCPRILRVLSA
jgi:hypothetical protein